MSMRQRAESREQQIDIWGRIGVKDNIMYNDKNDMDRVIHRA